jgi:hypothetical protein
MKASFSQKYGVAAVSHGHVQGVAPGQQIDIFHQEVRRI